MHSNQKRFRSIIFSLNIIAFLCTGCQPPRLPELSLNALSTRMQFEDKDRFRVSIEPYTKKSQLQEYFGIDLLEYAILPVLVVIENHGDKDVLVQSSDFSITTVSMLHNTTVTKTGTVAEPIDVERKSVETTAKGGALGVVLVANLAIPAAVLVVFPAGLILDRYNRKRVEVAANLNRKALLDKVVYQGEKHYGFIYLKLEGQLATPIEFPLEAKFRPLGKSQLFSFQFSIRVDEEDLCDRVKIDK